MIIELDILEIKPYWRNPRENRNAVKAVKESIKRFGYIKPILIDGNNVIIAGHARYFALFELGFNKARVMRVSMDHQLAKKFRIIDNKAWELSDWDSEELMKRAIKSEDMSQFREFFKIEEWEELWGRIEQTNLSNEILSTPENKEIEVSNMDVGETEPIVSSRDHCVCPECRHSFYLVE